MKVLVTGGAGFVGSTTAQRLVEAGHEVVVLDTLLRGFRGDPAADIAAAAQIVAKIVEMCFDAGAKQVKVGDNPVNVARKTYASATAS